MRLEDREASALHTLRTMIVNSAQSDAVLSASPDADDGPAPAQLARKYRAYYSARAAIEWVDGHRLAVGYDLELLGTEESHAGASSPGCLTCEAVWKALRQIALASLPEASERESLWTIDPFDRALHVAPTSERTPRDDVRLTLELRHKGEVFEPVDGCEDACLRDMIAALRALGVQKERWVEPL